MCTTGPTGATGPVGNSAPMRQFSVALNSPVPLSSSSRPVPFTIVLCGNDDESFNLMEYNYKVPVSGRYCFTCTASFSTPAGAAAGTSINLALRAGLTELQNETYSFQAISLGVFVTTMTLKYYGFFEAQTPVFVTANSTATGTTIFGPTVQGFAPWSTLFTGRMI